MTDYTGKQNNTEITDIQPFIPMEAALLGSVMAIVTILTPVQPGANIHLNSVMLLGFGGFLLFLIAKLSLISSGQMSTWGPGPMRVPFKISYVFGYLLMIVGGFMMLTSSV